MIACIANQLWQVYLLKCIFLRFMVIVKTMQPKTKLQKALSQNDRVFLLMVWKLKTQASYRKLYI